MKKVFLGLGLLVALTGCSFLPNNSMEKTDSGLQYEVLTKGKGDAVQNGDLVSVHYTGWLDDGTKFDSSVDRGTPFQFMVGAGQVIKGWDEGVEGMLPGEKRKLIIPFELGYGKNGYGPIPAEATLTFDVELMEIVK